MRERIPGHALPEITREIDHPRILKEFQDLFQEQACVLECLRSTAEISSSSSSSSCRPCPLPAAVTSTAALLQLLIDPVSEDLETVLELLNHVRELQRHLLQPRPDMEGRAEVCPEQSSTL